jgi:predicted DNA-binding protein (MmcQ/YjbR family)
MDLETVRNYLLEKPAATEDQPFGPDVLVFRIAGKIFALLPIEAFPARVNLKCNPDLALELRDRHEAVQPGYHMNKKHWNTVLLDGTIPVTEIKRMIDHSYQLVAANVSGRSAKEPGGRNSGKFNSAD